VKNYPTIKTNSKIKTNCVKYILKKPYKNNVKYERKEEELSDLPIWDDTLALIN
jgi:hypothetical protein